MFTEAIFSEEFSMEAQVNIPKIPSSHQDSHFPISKQLIIHEQKLKGAN